MFSGEHRSPEFKKINPIGKVPALIDGDFCVWDSHAIAIYMVEKYAKDDSLYPKDLEKRTMINARLFFEASYLFQRLYEILIPLYFGEVKEVPKNKVAETHAAYEIIEGFLDGNSYVAGDTLTLADLSIWANLLSFQFLVPVDEKKFPKLTKWLERMNSLPTYEINQSGANEHLTFIQRCINGQPIVPKILTNSD